MSLLRSTYAILNALSWCFFFENPFATFKGSMMGLEVLAYFPVYIIHELL